MNYLLGLDLGTSGLKAVLFDESGTQVLSASQEYPLLQPQNGWAEQDPLDWYRAASSTIRSVLQSRKVSAGQIAGIGISGQMHGLVMIDSAGAPLYPSILWCDGRTGRECAEMEDALGRASIIRVTGNPPLPGFTASKLLWVRKHRPQIYRDCAKILLPKDFLRFLLTGAFATDPSDASGTNLMDISSIHWSDDILRALSINPTLLPPIFPSSHIAGRISPQAASDTGLLAGTPVVTGAADNIAAAVGMGVVQKDRAFITIGTSGVIFAHCDDIIIDPLGRVHTFCHALPKTWAVMSCTLSAGLSTKWLRDLLSADAGEAPPMSYSQMDELARQVPIGADQLLFLPYLMGERSPILDETCRGAFIGLSAMHQRQHLIRAVMEGVSYSQRQCLDVLKGLGLSLPEIRVCGGGGNSGLWRQMLADILECSILKTDHLESAALGAAILAGAGCGVFPTVEQGCAHAIHATASHCPVNTADYLPMYSIYRELYPALSASFCSLSSLRICEHNV